MTRDEIHALLALARRLQTTPRRILVRAAQATGNEKIDAHEALLQLRQIGTRHSALADDCCSLLLTPVASYAKSPLGSALDLTWQGIHQARE
ncbi:MAG TPA: hypothetical protein VFN25_08665 [Dokdonella sp.]|uniref:hypothetical protein n=1 Tax=Dokdonella sp. TaxID=2291710 RepID=UPI002D80C35C|nr:hypothetical protein [Dokdonella sp.]HET9032964.1 hypothetical protein [Dokdonella sp.]